MNARFLNDCLFSAITAFPSTTHTPDVRDNADDDDDVEDDDEDGG